MYKKMEKDGSFISYNEMLKQIEGQRNNNLLLGNGVTIHHKKFTKK